MHPVIGISCYVEKAQWGVWDTTAALLPQAYVDAVARAGGIPLLVPPAGAADPDRLLDRLDGLVLAGGADIDPTFYDEPPNAATAGLRPDRDAAEIPLALAALSRDVPLLGICRGAQILNVARGGSLVQHLPDEVGHEGHRPSPGVYGEHRVRLAEGSRLGALLGKAVEVRSYHHQGIGTIGAGLVPTAWADDHTVEGLEDPRLLFAVGALWHPEAGDDPRLFDALVAAASSAYSGVT
ncbi:MAG: putative glutamine amidotransferase [Frankiales bacterium]|nr:putative glutamine amidotransferase [Frankiales bacterium]